MKLGGEAVLVVGGAGYIGSHMVRFLQDEGYHVIVLDNLSTGDRRLIPGINLVHGSLGNSTLLNEVFEQNRINTVMHFAACALVGESVQVPLKYYENNVSETIHLLDSMVRHNVRRFIFSSTAAVYGEPDYTPINENHPRQPTNPYGNSKLCVERMLADCDSAYGIRSICLRYFNAAGAHPSGTIGEMHDPETHLIPLILKNALASTPIKVFGTDYPTEDGTCIRDYVHVCDLARAHLLSLQALNEGHPSAVFNLGNSIGHSVTQVIDVARKVTGIPIETELCDRRPGDPAVLVASSDRIRSELNWVPEFENLEEIIGTAWKWHSRIS